MKNDSYLVVEESALPEVYQKVVKANALLESGEASTASEAVRKAGISRSVYYKYRDAVFPIPKASSGILTVQVILTDRPGACQPAHGVLPGGGKHPHGEPEYPRKAGPFVSVSARIDTMEQAPGELIESLKQVGGVIKIDSIVD